MSDLSRITERYNLDKLIHAGDTASVFRATDLRSGEQVALKLLSGSARFSEPPRRERFESAARALAECRHECLPNLLDFGVTTGGGAFLVMDYLPGATLDLLTGSPPERILPLLLPVLGALEEIDRHQLAHRALRADNLLVVPRGSRDTDEHDEHDEHDDSDERGESGESDPRHESDEHDEGGEADHDEQVRILGWGSATWGSGEEGRRADLSAFAELTCTMLGARVERTAAPVVTLPAAAGTRAADSAELAILLSLLLQPGGSLPASLYPELRRALHKALHGGADPEATQPGLTPGTAAGPAAATAATAGRRRSRAAPAPRPPPAPALDDPDELEKETRALRGDITMAVPRERLPRAPQGRAATPTRTAQSPGADPAASPPLAPARSPLTAARVRTETMPSFLASDLSSAPAGAPPSGIGQAAAPGGAPDIASAAGAGPDAAPRPSVADWPPTRVSEPSVAAILPFPSSPAEPAGSPGTWSGTLGTPLQRPVAAPLAPSAPPPSRNGVPQGPGPPPPAARPAGADPNRRGARHRRPALYAAAIAALLVLGALATPALRRRLALGYATTPAPPSPPARAAAGSRPPEHPAVPVPAGSATPAAPPPPPLDPRLAAAEALLASGDPAGARRALAEIPADRQTAFAPADRESFDRLTAALSEDRRARRAQIAADLAAGFRRGDLRRLNAALAGARREPDLPAAVRQDLDRARQAVELDTHLTQIDRAQNPLEALHAGTQLLALLPHDARAADLREQAARAAETQVEAALTAGDAGHAATLAAGLRQEWPDRPGVQERVAQIDAQRRGDEHHEAVLAAAARAEAAGQPLQGLDTLAAATPTGRFRERFGQQRERLNQLLARLDAAPPSIALRPGWKAEYDKGATVVVPLRITDDFAVKSAEAWVRPEGAAGFQQVPVRHLDGADYQVDIPAALHQNQPLELYVTATDNSGHQSLLGSRDKPLKIKRRNWIEKIFTGKEQPATGQ
jgi:serine/threonine protein kinase